MVCKNIANMIVAIAILLSSTNAVAAPEVLNDSTPYRTLHIRIIVEHFRVKPGELASVSSLHERFWILAQDDDSLIKTSEKLAPDEIVLFAMEVQGALQPANKHIFTHDIVRVANEYRFNQTGLVLVRPDRQSGLVSMLIPHSLPDESRIVIAPVATAYVGPEGESGILTGMAVIDPDILGSENTLDVRFQFLAMEQYDIGTVVVPSGFKNEEAQIVYSYAPVSTGRHFAGLGSKGQFSLLLPPLKETVVSGRMQYKRKSHLIDRRSLVFPEISLADAIKHGIEMKPMPHPDPWLEISYELVDHQGNSISEMPGQSYLTGYLWPVDLPEYHTDNSLVVALTDPDDVIRMREGNMRHIEGGYYYLGILSGFAYLDIKIQENGKSFEKESSQRPVDEHRLNHRATESQRVLVKLDDRGETTRVNVVLTVPEQMADNSSR